MQNPKTVRLRLPLGVARDLANLLNDSLRESEELLQILNDPANKGNKRLQINAEEEIVAKIMMLGSDLREINQATERAQLETDRLAVATQEALARLEERFGC
jgi:hypothetical protein